VAKTFRMGVVRRVGNVFVTLLIRTNLAPRANVLLTTTGRKSGLRRTNPVQLATEGERKWLVAPYGVVPWVRNVRASKTATLTRGSKSEDYMVREVTADEAAPILKQYVAAIPIVLPYFEAAKDSDIEAFKAEADRHPVFELIRA
jgi:deazaflavin-dependent oxidoreductase (nitroreductase family)